jgi:glutamyl-tRNA reductase
LFHLRQLPGVEESVVISTCNRLEVYAVVRSAKVAEPIMAAICDYYELNQETIRPHLYVEPDERAVQHLMRVASGLDSMILGESQILGQVREALNTADAVGSAGTLLHRLFEVAMHTGKRAHNETPIGEHTTSVSHAAARLVMNNHANTDANILLVGTGEMAVLAGQALKDRGYHNLHVVNRTYSNAVHVAERLGAQAHEWSFVWDCMAEADAVISATGAPHLILYTDDMRYSMARRRYKALTLVDIAVPRDIDPDISTLPGACVYDIDELQNVVDENVAQRTAAVPQVEAIVNVETEKYMGWQQERSITPVIVDLRREVQSVVEAELEDALGKLDTLGEAERKIVQRMAHRIVNKVLHAPTVSLRAHATSGNAENYAQVVRDLFALSISADV